MLTSIGMINGSSTILNFTFAYSDSTKTRESSVFILVSYATRLRSSISFCQKTLLDSICTISEKHLEITADPTRPNGSKEDIQFYNGAPIPNHVFVSKTNYNPSKQVFTG